MDHGRVSFMYMLSAAGTKAQVVVPGQAGVYSVFVFVFCICTVGSSCRGWCIFCIFCPPTTHPAVTHHPCHRSVFYPHQSPVNSNSSTSRWTSSFPRLLTKLSYLSLVIVIVLQWLWIVTCHSQLSLFCSCYRLRIGKGDSAADWYCYWIILDSMNISTIPT